MNAPASLSVRCPLCSSSSCTRIDGREKQGKTYTLVYCRGCGLYFANPPPLPEDIPHFYDGDYHCDLRRIDGTEAAFEEKFQSYKQGALEFVESGRSLDIGTATGLFPALMKEAGFDAEGLEYNSSSAEWGTAHFGITIRIGGVESLTDATENAYDFISMTDVLEHTAHPLNALKTVARCLKPGGHMLITFPDIRSVDAQYRYFLGKVTGRKRVWKFQCPLHVWEFSPQTARAMFALADLDVVGFRRSNWGQDQLGGVMGGFTLPLRVLQWRPLATHFGSQMEFMLHRYSSKADAETQD